MDNRVIMEAKAIAEIMVEDAYQEFMEYLQRNNRQMMEAKAIAEIEVDDLYKDYLQNMKNNELHI